MGCKSTFILRRLFAAIAFVGGAACSAPQTARDTNVPVNRTFMERELYKRIEEIRLNSRIPGMHIAVADLRSATSITDAKFLIDLPLGVRSQRDGTLVSASDLWHLGSCTKPMTAVLVGQAVERGNLGWHSSLETYLAPTGRLFPKNGLHASLKPATIDQLLSHQAGLVDVTTPLEGRLWAGLYREDLPARNMRTTLTSALLTSEAVFAPGTSTSYSNSGYVVLGSILERLSDKAWETQMREKIFAPLGMDSCGFGPVGTRSSKKPDQPWGHRLDTGRGTSNLIPVPPSLEADNPPALGPAGTAHCSVKDWMKFLAVFFNDSTARTKIIGKDTFTHLIDSAQNGFTYSSVGKIDRRSWAGGPVFSMAGSNTYNYAIFAVAPSKRLIIAITANAGHSDAEAGVIKILKLVTESLPESFDEAHP